MQTMVGKLIAANVAVFVIQGIFPDLWRAFALTPRLVVQNFHVWQLGTYMFLHDGFMHLLFNMVILWIFGSTIESVWGSRQFLKYYLICGLGGGILSLFFYTNPIVGASGAIFGLYLAYAMMFPNNHIYLYFVFPVKAKYLVVGIVVFQLVSGISGPQGIAYFAHLGGMLAGLVFFQSTLLQRARFSFGPKRKWKAYVAEKNSDRTEQDKDNIDSILDKITAKGYENLSTTERKILDNYSRDKREKKE